MNEHCLTLDKIRAFGAALRLEERSRATQEKYLRELQSFADWLDGAAVSREKAVAWKEELLARAYNPATVNGKLAALNAFFRFIGWEDCRVKALKLQRRLFRDRSRELSQTEYSRLLETAQTQGKERLLLLMETICATGIRVSELRYITRESLEAGKAEVTLKGKIRTILLPGKLCRKLLKYAKKQRITSGEIFLTRGGRSLSRKQIWAEMKRLCEKAGVEPSKVFPHNLRHLFARCFYRACRDIARLADLLGHSSVETTRIYLISTGEEHEKTLERLGLVS